jgi:NO-binding membrane sensor protein with MHYT domain
MLTVHNFQYGAVTPVAADLLSCLGVFLGLRCTARARVLDGAARARWLVLAAVGIGALGIWVMHFIAMLGFAIPGETIRYSVPNTLISVVIAVSVVGIGLFIVGFGQPAWRNLILAGVITGVGVASVHYAAMGAMRMPALMSYNVPIFAVSVLVAIAVATTAFWAAIRLTRIWPTIGAAAIIGSSVTVMHYTGMAAMRISRPPMGMIMNTSGATIGGFLIPLICCITLTTFLLISIIGISPSAPEIIDEAELLERSRARGLQV